MVIGNRVPSKLVTSLMYAKRNQIPSGFVISGTEDSSGHYGKIYHRPLSIINLRSNCRKIHYTTKDRKETSGQSMVCTFI